MPIRSRTTADTTAPTGPAGGGPISVPALNAVALVGRLSRPAATRVLPSGDVLVALEVTVASDGSRPSESVPVVWPSPPAWAGELDAGIEVVVVGRVRRRYFRAGGVTASRTEIVAKRVVPARQRARASRAVREVAEQLTALIDDPILGAGP